MKMKANELRIGNYFIYDNRVNEVLSIYINFGKYRITFKNENKSKLVENCNPIPLTEEWLLRFGFEKVIDGYEFNNYHIDIEKIRPYFGYSWQDYRTPIDYVHQLQNLYFALTGEELNINK